MTPPGIEQCLGEGVRGAKLSGLAELQLKSNLIGDLLATSLRRKFYPKSCKRCNNSSPTNASSSCLDSSCKAVRNCKGFKFKFESLRLRSGSSRVTQTPRLHALRGSNRIHQATLGVCRALHGFAILERSFLQVRNPATGLWKEGTVNHHLRKHGSCEVEVGGLRSPQARKEDMPAHTTGGI